MKSLHRSIVLSHQIPIIFSSIAVIVSILLAFTIYIYSNNILNFRVPNTKLVHQLITSVNNSMSHLKTSMLLGDTLAKKQRKFIWSTQIPKIVKQIEIQIIDSDKINPLGNVDNFNTLNIKFTKVKQLLSTMEDTQWWIDDISSSKGGNPSRIIYDRDILPIFSNLNSAIEGLMYDDNYNPIESHELRVSLLTAHHHLSDGLRELTEAVRTGSLPHVKSFRRQAELLDVELTRFLKMASEKGTSGALLNWVVTSYKEYLKLANKSIEMRQSNDSNLGVQIYREEALPLAQKINALLEILIDAENKLLVTGAEEINSELLFFLLITAAIFLLSVLINYFMARYAAIHYTTGINELTLASKEMIKGRLKKLDTQSKFEEINNLLITFSNMQNAVSDRELKLKLKQNELNQLTHIVTHDMKPPVINIKGHLGIISDKISTVSWNSAQLEYEISELQQQVDESLGYINQSVARIGELIKAILTFKQLSTQKFNIDSCNLDEIINNVLAINSHRLKKSTIIKNEDFGSILCDNFVLKTVISTIVDNAIQYQSPSRSLVISFSYKKINDYHQLSICDNGLGIPQNLKESIYCLSGSPSKRTFNFGIGLAGVKKLLDRSGGKIWHEPNLDTEGTCFYFELPELDNNFNI